MEKLKKNIKFRFAMAMLFTLFLPAGIVSIIFGGTKGMTALLVVGIVMAVLGFYGSPMWWIGFGELKSKVVLMRLILNENVYSISELATQLSTTPENVNKDINYLILNNYLTGYLVHGDLLELNRNKKQDAKNTKKSKCPNCGGVMEFDGVNWICQYCGHTVSNDKNNA